ncbi:DNA metabolism protein [Lithospermum erythrorhizon]|uniref:Poly [ADP-ribose] polymerase n=1 Tax=Lithospermum erythrorhizon TaxID=34254 RepID=A0AAV3P9X8_LITER
MSSELKVDQLRAELSKRGLSIAGIKPILVKRLESAIEAEKMNSNSVTDSKSRKRQRGDDDEDIANNGANKMKEINEFKNMTVKELREEAILRGISSCGTKKELTQRLCEVAENDSNSSVKFEDREDIDEKTQLVDGSKSEIKSIEDLKIMNVKQIREEASRRGVSSSGTKKELLLRLCAGAEDSLDMGKTTANDPGEIEEAKEEKLVTATRKGAAVLDNCLPENIKSQYHVLQNGDDIYDAMLNQTNVGDNNNKFYVIQVLESDDDARFMLFNRWGRVGHDGQSKLTGPCSKDSAVTDFESKFYAKTKNCWANRKDFVSYPKHYTWLEMDYGESEKESSGQGTHKPPMDIQPRETKLENRIAKFISLICNISMMKQQMMEIGYNAEKLPLGKLSKSTILKGYDVLKRISEVIDQSNRKMLEQLSGEFYTVIPHDFGYKKMREFVIDTPQKLKRKLEMVEALGEIEVATKMLNDDMDTQDPLYSQYRRLKCELMPVEADSGEFSMIETYMKNTHARTHSDYAVNIVQIFKISKEGEAERFTKFSEARNRMLLWHGSRLTNWTGILSQGLRIAPPEAPATGYMFGKGVYFADMFSKSANYCFASASATDGVLLLCEVALGEMNELLTADYNADKLPSGKLSTKGVGGTSPNFSKAKILEDGVVVPLGKPKKQKGTRGDLLYNEYIVYNVKQIRMRYVIHVNFSFRGRNY